MSRPSPFPIKRSHDSSPSRRCTNMQQDKPYKHWMLIVAVLLVAPIMSGCFGEDDPKAADDQSSDVEVKKKTDGDEKKDEISKNTDHSGAKNEPSAHFHHYWGDPPAASVKIYDGGVPFNNYDTKYRNSHNTLAWAEFGLEDDGDDVMGGDTDPVNGEMADTVFAGTNRITVQFPEAFPPGVNSMRFQYKPSNTPIFFPEQGFPVSPGDVYTIKLEEVGMSDPPHQFTTSRWQFRLFASNELCAEYGLEGDMCPPTVIRDDNPTSLTEGTQYEWGSRGGNGIVMIAHNGGQEHLDPPHPDFWRGSDVKDLGSVGGTVAEPAAQTPLVRERVSTMTGISMPPNYIVPLGTEKVEVRVRWTNEFPTDEHAPVRLQLYYHGADSIEYESAGQHTVDGDWHVYEIFDSDGSKVDPPYESNSFWRFQLVPVMDAGGNQQEQLGVFQGDFEMQFKAHKVPGFVLE